MHDDIKKATGIKNANCDTCLWLGSDGDGYEYNGTWPICENPDMANVNNLKSFPFKKDMKCWQPEFWASKFPDMIKKGTPEEMNMAAVEFSRAIIAI